MGDYYLELTVTVTGGSIRTLGRLEVLCWLKATSYAFLGPEAVGTLVHRPLPGGPLVPSDFDPPADEVRSLVDLLQFLEFPGRKPRVARVVDTSDVWRQYDLAARLDGRHDTFAVAVACSGFAGADAPLFRDLLRQLFSLGGLLIEELPQELH